MLLFQEKEISKHGLVEIRLELQYPKLYLDAYIEIITRKNKIIRNAITLRPGALRTRVLRIPKDTKEIRLKPQRYDGKIELKKKELVKFIFPITLWIIYGRLKHHKLKFHPPMSKLWRTYNQTFNINMGIKNYSFWNKLREPHLIAKKLKRNLSISNLNIIITCSEKNEESSSKPIYFNQIKGIKTHDLTTRKKEVIEKIEQALDKDTYFLILLKTDKINNKVLERLNSELSNSQTSDLIYTDEDFITNGKRHSPQFKPNWNPELWEESNYIGRAVIFKAKLLKHIDWTTFYPSEEKIKTAINRNDTRKLKISHSPHILLHRELDKLPFPNEEKWHNNNACIKKTDSRLQRYSVELIIPIRDKVGILKNCINSIFSKTNYVNFNVTVIDNDSSETETLDYLEHINKHARVKVLKYPHPFNYSAINNFGASQSNADILVLVNNDIEVISPNWLEEMVSIAIKEDVGCVGAKLYYPNGWIQHAGVILGIGDIAGHSHRFYPGESLGYMNRLAYRQQVSAVTAACLAIKRSIWNEVNGLDEKNLTVAYNDVDFCLRVQELGYRNIWTPYAELTHHESVSRGADDTPQKKKRYKAEVAYMKKRWAQELKQDPFYHPAFSRTKEDFSLQF